MNGKPVHSVPAKSVLNLESGFAHKLLCDGPTFSAGSACAYDCTFCYVPELMKKSPHLSGIDQPHHEVVIRRSGAVDALRAQLTDRHGRPKYLDPGDRRVIYASPLVDIAANLELCRETVELCKAILDLTHWQIRLLSKSNLLPKIAQWLEAMTSPGLVRERLIFGVSTGTLDDKLTRAIEGGTPLVSKRLDSLRWLQDQGFRTFGMLCPSLPQGARSYRQMAREMATAIRADRCEHVWGEVINVRGESMTRTISALQTAGFDTEAQELAYVGSDRHGWEQYARETFLGHAVELPPGKLRFLQYVTPATAPWWKGHEINGAVLL